MNNEIENATAETLGHGRNASNRYPYATSKTGLYFILDENGEIMAEAMSEIGCWAWFHKNSGSSVYTSLTRDGYKMVEAPIR